MNWLKKNWLKLIIVFVSIIGFLWISRACSDAKYEKKIDKLDDEISVLKKKNVKLEEETVFYINDAVAERKKVEKLKTEVAESEVRIEELEKKEIEVEEVVMVLPPSELVEETKEILGCAEILLNEQGILFSVECAREGLLKLKRFSVVEEKFDEAIFALSKSKKALVRQERVSWHLFGALWKMGDQIINYKAMVKKQDIKFDLSEKQRKSSFWSGLKLGFVLGVGISVTVIIIIPVIKKLI